MAWCHTGRREARPLSYDAISPVDGRYAEEAKPLARFFSERALARERVAVELSYLGLLVKLGVAPKGRVPKVHFSMERVKEIEDEVGHDVKAAEVFLRESLEAAGSDELAPYVHLGLTSEDTNSVAFGRLLAASLTKVLIPAYEDLVRRVTGLAWREAKTPMLARTHGRPAVPTTFGKELAVFAVRMAERVGTLKAQRPVAKVSGAAGTYASFLALKRLDWKEALAGFVSEQGLDYAPYTTQVVPGERLSDILHTIASFNTLLSSLCRDLWLYQTLDRIQFTRPGKVSSSTMPQKVNPVDVENAEGQADISNALLVPIAYRLQVTRLQRDLSDSVVRRMVGQGMAHSLVACKRLQASLASMKVDRPAMKAELDAHPEVLAEAAQLSLRLAGDARGYEKVKKALEEGEFSVLKRLGLEPEDYLGLAAELAAESPKLVARLMSGRRPTA